MLDTKFLIRQGKYIRRLRVTLTHDDNNFYVSSMYDKDLVTELRLLKGAKWDKQNQVWHAPICERNAYTLFYLQGFRIQRFEDSVPGVDTLTFSRPLFKHQKEGVCFALHRRQCMLAFEMGLGKTLAAIEIMERAAKEGSFCWWLVAPYGAQQEWKRQLIKWRSKVHPVVITTYESLHKYMEAIEQIPHGVIFDESIKIKNPNAQRASVAAELTRLVRTNGESNFIILLSGAPAPKRPDDWWHQVECIYPGWIREPNIHRFRERYANLIEIDYGFGPHKEIQSWKEEEVRKLGKRLAPLVLVKHKRDCFEIPDKIFDEIVCIPDEELKRFASFIVDTAKSSIEALEKLRELSDGFQYIRKDDRLDTEDTTSTDSNYTWIDSPKINIVKELLDFYSLENGGCGRLIIYAVFHATIDKLMKVVKDCKWYGIKIDGRGWSDAKALDRFDDPNFKQVCIIANPQCVYGLNFSKTQALVYYSNSFSTDARIQSMERRDRPGMDPSKGTRIVDIINLETDKLILEKLKGEMGLQDVTLQEIKKWLQV